jgi:hypothetical protein
MIVSLFAKAELERELRTLIETLVVEIKNDADNKNQAKLIHIQEETLIKMKTCFQELVC